MGNGKNKHTGKGKLSQGAMQPTRYRLTTMPDGFIAIAPEQSTQVSGYMVPKAFAALFFLFYRVAPRIQEKHELPNPTKGQVDEILKRYVKSLGAIFDDKIEEAILSVMGPDAETTEEEEWDFAEEHDPSVFVPGRAGLIPVRPGLYDEKGKVITSDSDDDEDDSAGGNADVPTGGDEDGSGS